MPDLSTTYLGFTLKNPLVVSASPLSEALDNLRRMEDAGAAAVVLHSLFEEQLTVESLDLDQQLGSGSESFSEALTYFPDMADYNLGPEGYLEHLRQAKAAVEIPIIASLNGTSTGSWIRYARLMEEAGADALELNIYDIPTNPRRSSAHIERQYVDLVRDVAAAVHIPVAAKLGHAFSTLAHLARRLDQAGAKGLVLFNRFYQPDFDLENLEIVPHLQLSQPYEVLPRLHWVAILFGQIGADMAITGGVHTATEVLKAMMAGARVAMMTSALLLHGIEHLATVQQELVKWMEAHEYTSIGQMQGSMSRQFVVDPSAFERANYLRVLRSAALNQRDLS